ncbi:C4-dicarboxylate ABC transporter [Vibrio sp. UCD-FRSSP16_10]|uniref:TDT family transporter n=1 Tax=unclassified Vibrio TaxID=2614977 RepID=UPI0008013FA5|nr:MULTISPECIES: TDT family transporter [unclassified Vibrio]OBT06571.1 C4-dicarboxylate ABC transporter [Vibrio sp. UCD-FRSSP16_30]OBT12268.1 C4-dicarboxylate ABC transporter [Vibrio sp. UCD-FRSSP16_10]
MQTQSRLANAPTPMAGLALGIASLGWCLENLGLFNGYAQITGALIASVLLFVLMAKFLFHRHLLKQDLSHPVVGSVVPTFAMASMVVSFAIGQHLAWLGNVIWVVSVVLHILFLASFSFHRSQNFELHHMLPSWFVPPVGIVVAALTYSGSASLHWIGETTLYFGMGAYAIMLPMMIYRLMFSELVEDAAKPTLAILAAPASLSLAGYLSFVESPSPMIVALLFGIAILMTGVIYIAFFRLLKLPFSPGYSAFTFPLVISATAMFKVALWMDEQGIASEYVQQVHTLAVVELIIAFGIVSYVALQYFNNLLIQPRLELATK